MMLQNFTLKEVSSKHCENEKKEIDNIDLNVNSSEAKKALNENQTTELCVMSSSKQSAVIFLMKVQSV